MCGDWGGWCVWGGGVTWDATHKGVTLHRYIEIFKSSLVELKSALTPRMRGLMNNSPMGRPGPYDRGDRFGNMGGGMGGGGMGGSMNQGMGFARGRGRGTF